MNEQKAKQYEREGECNCCGDCCKATAMICDEEGIAEFLSHRGIDKKEQIVNVMLTVLGPDRVKFTLFEKCDALIDIPGLPEGKEEARCTLFSLTDDKRMPKCKSWPSIPAHLTYVPRCSYEFKEKS